MVLVVPPPRPDANIDHFTPTHFEKLYPLVSAFCVVTYDFSSPQRPGANAPLYWINHAVEHICPNNTEGYRERRQKVQIGLNLYGNDYTPDGSGDTVVGSQFLDLLKHFKGRLYHDEHDEENYFEIK